MQKLEYKYCVFDGAYSHFFVSFEGALLCFAYYLHNFPQYANIIELHEVLTIGLESRILLRGDEVDAS